MAYGCRPEGPPAGGRPGARSQQVEKALNLLRLQQKKGARIIKKVLESAIANAEHNDGADIDEPRVTKHSSVEQGPRPCAGHAQRAKGRGNRISKPTCHIFVTVGDEEKKAAIEERRQEDLGRHQGPQTCREESAAAWLQPPRTAMGQKIHPTGFRLGLSTAIGDRAGTPAGGTFPGDAGRRPARRRDYLKGKLSHASVGRVVIERPAKNARITIYPARPGVVIVARRARTSRC